MCHLETPDYSAGVEEQAEQPAASGSPVEMISGFKAAHVSLSLDRGKPRKLN